MRKALFALLSALACASSPAHAQVWIGGGVWTGVPVIVVPVPYDAFWHPFPPPPANARAPGVAPSCLRVGRCTVEELEIYYQRPEMLERRAPAAPDPGRPLPRVGPLFAPGFTGTPEEEVQPRFRGSSVPRAEFESSGQPLDPRVATPR